MRKAVAEDLRSFIIALKIIPLAHTYFGRFGEPETFMRLSRRKFIIAGSATAAGAAVGGYALYRMGKSIRPLESPELSEVYLIDASDRVLGIKKLFEKFSSIDFRGAEVALKANYNSADPFPASTHIDTLETIIREMNLAGASRIILAERSGMGDTRRVLEDRGVMKLADKLGFEIVILDDVPADGWQEINPDGLHWLRGFKIAKIFTETKRVVQTCCLKTHRFGGHITMSLKNSVGLVTKKDPDGIYDYMAELHTSIFQRLMIAEINRFYKVDLIIMDGTEALVRGGPDKGELVKPNLILASKDRIAIDAVGVALLRSYGTTSEVMKGKIFELEQIHRATELGVGIDSPSKIKLIPLDRETEKTSQTILKILNA